ncbi:MAG TPA: anti-sigma factor [Pyrinomonadaceae bacterium]|nr:anti-sigma factor [Pyrinomonadaceae bacterium]
MEHETYREMLSEAALGALGPEDERALEAHLRECDACRAERDELRDVAALLAHTVAPVAPPAELRSRILDRIKTSPAPGATETGATRARESRTTQTSDARRADGGAAKVLPFSAERKSTASFISPRLFNATALAASLLLAALVALVVIWQRDRAELIRLSASNQQLSSEAERARRELAAARESSDLLTSPETLFATLEGTKAAPNAGARVAFDSQTGRALLLAYDLPPAPAGKAYQLWFIKGTERPVPGHVFKPDERGRGSLRDQAPPEGLQADTFAVTLEPEQGVPQATGEIYLVGKIS